LSCLYLIHKKIVCKKYIRTFTIYHRYQSHLLSSKGSLVTSIKPKATDNYHKTDMFYFILYRRSAVTRYSTY
jgi:hypothetical protein